MCTTKRLCFFRYIRLGGEEYIRSLAVLKDDGVLSMLIYALSNENSNLVEMKER